MGTSKAAWRYANPFLFFKIKKACKKLGINCLVIEHPYYGWLGALLKYFAGIKLIVHSHNIESTRFRTLGKRWWRLLFHYEKFTHRKAALSFFISASDQQFAIQNFGLLPHKTMVCTYGIPGLQPTPEADKKTAKQHILEQYQLEGETVLLLFNGTLSYQPNLDAVKEIVEKINPLLQKQSLPNYKIIICGKGLPDSFNNLEAYKDQDVIYAGFVDDIKLYFDAADVFINPVTDGGGIKTKLIEALAANARAVSYASGAIGVDAFLTGGNMKIVEDGNATAFVSALTGILARQKSETPAAFFDHFNWRSITRKAAEAIERLL